MGCRAKEFSTEESRMAETHLKKCSIFLVIREMQIKKTLRLHILPIRMAKIKISGDSRCWQGCGERATLLHGWWDCKLVQLMWKSVRWFLRKLDIVLPENPAIPLLGIHPKDSPTYNKDTCSTLFIAALFILARRKNPDVLQQRNGYRKCGTFTQWSTTQLLKRMNSWNS